MNMSLLQTPSLLMYNKMLKSLADGKSFTKVLALFGELRGQGLYPDNFTLPVVLKSIGRLRKVIEGEKVHGYAVKAGLEFDSYVSNSLMGMYASLGKIEITHKVFDEMPQKKHVTACSKLNQTDSATTKLMISLSRFSNKSKRYTIV
jgi:pentatricopeptide repeat protein